MEDNRVDLQAHQAEFDRREAYAYSVFDRAATKCLGCAYLEPWAPGARLAWWVVDAARDSDLEAQLLQTLRQWFEQWPLP